MRFTSIALLATAATSALGFALPNPWSPIPGYPIGNGFCLSDDQANFIASTFKSLLTNPNRKAVSAAAQNVIADGYVETSDSINILAGFPIGGASFTGKQPYIQSLVYAPPIPQMDTLKVFHDCNNILWAWNAKGLGLNKYPAKGMNVLTVNNPATGQINSNTLEFNSVAWGTDIGWTCTPPPSGQS